MAKAKRLPQQIVKVKNYGDDWINRLAVVLTMTEKMDQKERSAVLNYLRSKYAAEWPTSD